jgi:hypothetical protein
MRINNPTKEKTETLEKLRKEYNDILVASPITEESRELISVLLIELLGYHEITINCFIEKYMGGINPDCLDDIRSKVYWAIYWHDSPSY